MVTAVNRAILIFVNRGVKAAWGIVDALEWVRFPPITPISRG